MSARVKYITDRLLLREYKSSLGRRLVYRYDEHDDVSLFDKVGDDNSLLLCAFVQSAYLILERVDIDIIKRADVYLVLLRLGYLSDKVGLGVGDDIRNILLFEKLAKLCFLTVKSECRGHYHNGNIYRVKHLKRSLYTKLAEVALVVKSGGIYDNYRAEG